MRAHWLLAAVLPFVLLCASLRAEDDQPKHFIEAEIALPGKTVFLRGEHDPIADLTVALTLKNSTPTASTTVKTLEIDDMHPFSEEERAELQKIAKEAKSKEEFESKRAEFGKKRKKNITVKEEPVNKDSLGYAYTPPQLGPDDLVEMIVLRLPGPDDKDADGKPAQPERIERDMAAEYTQPVDNSNPTRYLAAGATSDPYTLPVGKFYRIQKPGMYSVQAVIHSIPDDRTPEKCVMSNVVNFQILPYQICKVKLPYLKRDWEEFERGHPNFSYMFYELPVEASYREVYYVQRLSVRGVEKWEWHRLCTVAEGTSVQVQQVDKNKVALLAQHAKGDAGLYTVDFSTVDPTVTSQTLALKGGALPTLKVEGGTVSAE